MHTHHIDILFINTVNYGSTGNIMKQMSATAEAAGYTTCCAIAGEKNEKKKDDSCYIISTYTIRRINEHIDRLLGIRGYDSFFSTLLFLLKIDKMKPRIIHLHNLHSNYINLPLLFRYIKKRKIKTVWTLHDCWAFTGRCPHFTLLSCEKWRNGCYDCEYPPNSYPVAKHDKVAFMWRKKKKWFTGINDLTIVTPSEWLASLVRQSFLNSYTITTINNGIDLNVFKRINSSFREKYNITFDSYIVLGISFGWNNSKGLDCFVELARRLDSKKYTIVLVGTDETVESILPDNIVSIRKTKNQKELAKIYSAASVFVNPTREDTFPTVNIEALACGTPVITYRTGGSPEILDNNCGCIVACDDIDALIKQITFICENHPFTQEMCEQRAKKYSKEDMLNKYLQLYQQMS